MSRLDIGLPRSYQLSLAPSRIKDWIVSFAEGPARPRQSQCMIVIIDVSTPGIRRRIANCCCSGNDAMAIESGPSRSARLGHVAAGGALFPDEIAPFATPRQSRPRRCGHQRGGHDQRSHHVSLSRLAPAASNDRRYCYVPFWILHVNRSRLSPQVLLALRSSAAQWPKGAPAQVGGGIDQRPVKIRMAALMCANWRSQRRFTASAL